MSTEITKVGDNHYQVEGMPTGMKKEMDLMKERMANPACRKSDKMKTAEEKEQCKITAKEKAVQFMNDAKKSEYQREYKNELKEADRDYENG